MFLILSGVKADQSQLGIGSLQEFWLSSGLSDASVAWRFRLGFPMGIILITTGSILMGFIIKSQSKNR